MRLKRGRLKKNSSHKNQNPGRRHKVQGARKIPMTKKQKPRRKAARKHGVVQKIKP
jgi:hypothetical protein